MFLLGLTQANGQTLGTGVVLGEPGSVLGERGRRDRFGLDEEKVFSPGPASGPGLVLERLRLRGPADGQLRAGCLE